MPDPTREELETEYRTRRRVAREIVTDEFLDQGFNLTLTEIGRAALTAAAGWSGRRVSWQWEELGLVYSKRPKRIELAIWIQGSLVGLCYGMVSKGRMVARIDRLERDPNDSFLTGFVGQIATRFLDIMAAMCGCGHAVIWQPAPKLVEFYKALGYTNEMINHHGLIGLSKQTGRRDENPRGNYYGN